jgi:hypothetical protein
MFIQVHDLIHKFWYLWSSQEHDPHKHEGMPVQTNKIPNAANLTRYNKKIPPSATQFLLSPDQFWPIRSSSGVDYSIGKLPWVIKLKITTKIMYSSYSW